MTQRNIIQRRRVTYVGEESAFGTAPSGSFPNAMTKGVFRDAEIGLDPQETMLDVDDESIRRQDAVHPVHGLQSDSTTVSLGRLLRATPSAGLLTASGTPVESVDRILLKHIFGTEHAAVGTTVATGTSSTVFDATSAADIKKGSFIAVTVSGTPEWAKVTNISTATITVTPPFSGTPSTSAVVRNLYTYAPAENHSMSLSVYRGFVADSGTEPEYIVNGCYGSAAFDFPIGQIPNYTVNLNGTAFTGPAASGSIDTATTVSEAMGAPVVVKGAKLYIATSAISRATAVAYEKFSLEYNNQWEKVVDGGAAQAVAGVVNTAGRPRAVKGMVTLRFDAGSYDNSTSNGFGADDVFRMAMVITYGSGSTMSHWIVEIPRARITAKPKLTKVGERLYMDLEFSGQTDDQVTIASETGDDLARCYAPVRFAFG